MKNYDLIQARNGTIPQFEGQDGQPKAVTGDHGPYYQLVDVNGNPLFSENNPARVQLTGSIVEVFFDKIVPSEQTNNLFVGERSSSGIAGMTAIDISKYRKISIYIKNNTERPVLLRRLYFGLTADFRGDHIDNSGTNDIEIASDDYIYVTSRAENGIADYLTVELPFMGIHLFRGTEEPMSSGNFHVKLIGIK